jgi:hypothetical protein
MFVFVCGRRTRKEKAFENKGILQCLCLFVEEEQARRRVFWLQLVIRILR